MEKELVIQELGLNPLEARVYLCLLKLGGANASIVAQELEVKRTTIYDVLASLRKKGFATIYLRKNKRVYHAQQPQRVANLFEKKLQAFSEMIPQLLSAEQVRTQEIGVRFIQTSSELKQFYTDVLLEYARKSYDVIGSASSWIEVLGPEFVKRFRRDRAKAKIKTRVLLTENSRALEPEEGDLLRETHFLSNASSFESSIHIFPDQILIISPRLSSLAIVIAIPAMIDIFHSIFDSMWLSAKV